MFPISSLSFFFLPCFVIFAFNFVSLSFNFLKPNCFEFPFFFSNIKTGPLWKYLDPPLNTVFKSYFQHEYCVAVLHTSVMQKRATYTVGITFAVRAEQKLILEIVVQIAKKFDILKYNRDSLHDSSLIALNMYLLNTQLNIYQFEAIHVYISM